MSQTVFVLGAGASRSSGAPLMQDFLDVAERIWRAGRLDTETQAAFDLVFKGIAALRVAHSKARIDLDNVESVFAAFEMASLLGIEFEGIGTTEAERLASAMRTLIAVTLEEAVQLPIRTVGGARRVAPNPHYEKLAQLIRELFKRGPGSVSVVTFNYDFGLDFALHWEKVQFSYGLRQHQRRAVPLLKLHGSLNWGQCSKCRAIIPLDFEEFERSQTYAVDRAIRSNEDSFKFSFFRRCASSSTVRMLFKSQQSYLRFGTRRNITGNFLLFGREQRWS